jgi:hypothetical protein
MNKLGTFNLENNLLSLSNVEGFNKYLLKSNNDYIIEVTGEGSTEQDIILDIFANSNSYNAIGIKPSNNYNLYIKFISDTNINSITLFGLTE